MFFLRTPVIIRVANPDRLDYEREEGRNFVFRVNAVQGATVLSSVQVNVLVTDSNDNVPVFEQRLYEFVVPENADAGAPVGKCHTRHFVKIHPSIFLTYIKSGFQGSQTVKRSVRWLNLFSFPGQITATDADSGRFGQVEYALRGFGAEKFKVNPITGEIIVDGCGETILYCLDFETQQSYALTYTGTDGGKQVTSESMDE